MTQVNQIVKILNLFCVLMIHQDFWALETIGIKDPITLTDDDKALMNFNMF